MIDKNSAINKEKEILFLLTQDLGSPSGLGRYYPMAKELVKAGYAITIIALHSDYKSLSQNKLKQNGIDIHYVAQMHVKKEGNKTVYFKPWKLVWLTLLATWRLFWHAVGNKYDIILIGKPHPMNGIAGLLAGESAELFEAKSALFLEKSAWLSAAPKSRQRAERHYNGNHLAKLINNIHKNDLEFEK